MSNKFRGKYRTTSHRLKNFDYATNGAYFITIVTKNRKHYFGKIIDNEIVLNELGQIAKNEWEQTAEIRENVKIDEFVIMPNHIHGILWINNESNRRRDVLAKRLYDGEYPKMSEISPTKNSISMAIRFFKRQTTVKSRKIFPDFKWQPNYYDHIIRNSDELNRIRNYIIKNPKMWKRDRNNKGLWL